MNETEMNLTLSIVSPEETTYNDTMVLIEIDSNGDNVWFVIDGGDSETYTAPVTREFADGGTYALMAFATDSDEKAEASVVFKVDLNSSG